MGSSSSKWKAWISTIRSIILLSQRRRIKVAAWFLDTDYDGRTFCPTQSFFPNKKAWRNIARSLRTVIDEESLAAFSGTESLPFLAGKHNRIAVKVIDRRGNELMKIDKLRVSS